LIYYLHTHTHTHTHTNNIEKNNMFRIFSKLRQ